ncbi:MAG: rhamnulokinase family protein [Candidatus Cryptobacteroides sp.]
MTEKNFFAVDLGATSGRTILAAFDGKSMKMTEVTRFENPMIPLGGHLFWDLPLLYNEILKGLKTVSGWGVAIDSIGIDTWGVDVAFFGKDGQLLGLPYCYRDPHTDGAQERFFRKMSSKDLYGKTGIQFMNFNTVFNLDTLAENGCSALEAADKILFIPDALAYMLTGETVCEYTIASTSQMLNAFTREFDPDILSVLGLPRERFGRMVRPGEVIGTLSEQVRRETGLGAVKVIAVAGHDTASAVAAVPARGRGFAYLSCGTWSLLGIETPEPVINGFSYSENFTNEGGVEGTVRFLKNICGMWIFEQARKDFRDAPESVGELVALADTVDYPGVIDPDAECFAHPASMTDAIDSYCRATGQTPPSSPAEYCRCIFRSLALRCRQVIESLSKVAPEPVRTLNVIGGGSRNAFLMQYLADCLGITVVCGPVEGTAMGNALIQAKAAGVFSSSSCPAPSSSCPAPTGHPIPDQVVDDGEIHTDDTPSLLDKMREISAASVELTVYEPKAARNEEYSIFLNIQDIYGQENI